MTTCSYETPGLRAGDPPFPCQLQAQQGSSTCETHTWTIRKQKAQQRLTLARAASSEHEGANAAVAACSLMTEHQLVFHPKTPMIDRAVSVYVSAPTEDAKRKAALGVAKASVGSEVLRHTERDMLEHAMRQRTLGRDADRRAQEELEAAAKAAAVSFASSLSWMQAAVSVARDVLSGVETRDGRPLRDRTTQIREDLIDITEALSEPSARRRKPRAKAKATKKSKGTKKGTKTPPRRAT